MKNNNSLIDGSLVPGKNPVGHWVLGRTDYSSIRFAIFKKPNRFHRFMTNLLLGWKWEDAR
jgi:hypothetical protein